MTSRRDEARILGVLGESDNPVPIEALASRVNLDFLALSELLLDMSRRDAVILQGSPGREVVSLGPGSR